MSPTTTADYLLVYLRSEGSTALCWLAVSGYDDVTRTSFRKYLRVFMVWSSGGVSVLL